MHAPVAVVVLDICPVYSAPIIRDSSQPKVAGRISNPAEIPQPSPLADTPIMTWSTFDLTPCIPCALLASSRAILISQQLFSGTCYTVASLCGSRPKGCELQNGPRGLMFGLNAQWNSTANSFLTPPSGVWLSLHKLFSMLGGRLARRLLNLHSLLSTQPPERIRGQVTHRNVVLCH